MLLMSLSSFIVTLGDTNDILCIVPLTDTDNSLTGLDKSDGKTHYSISKGNQ